MRVHVLSTLSKGSGGDNRLTLFVLVVGLMPTVSQIVSTIPRPLVRSLLHVARTQYAYSRLDIIVVDGVCDPISQLTGPVQVWYVILILMV